MTAITAKHAQILEIANTNIVTSVFDKLEINYSVVDVEGNYIIQNNVMTTNCKGLKNAEVIDKTSWEDCKQVMRDGKRVIKEEQFEDMWYLSIKQPLIKSKKCLGIMVVSINITDRKQAVEKVIDFTSKLAGSMAHELRTPLAIIGTEVDLLNLALSAKKSQQEKDDTYRRVFRVVKDTIKSATYMIDDILIKIRSFACGKIKSVFKEASITTDVEEFLSAYPFTEGEKKLVKLKNFDNLESRFKYLGDSTLTKHIFLNLVKNSLHAVKEAEKGELIFELQKTGSTKDKFNYLIFRDTASGIPEKFVGKIFDKYATKKAIGGNGMGVGLSFCKMVMEIYGGDITCKPKEG